MTEKIIFLKKVRNFLSPVCIFVFLACLFLTFPAAADQWVGGEELETIQTGVVSGDVWFDSLYGTVGASGQPNTAEKSFTIPDYTEIKWARLYVVVYCGHMENNYQGQANVLFNGGQGLMSLGSETLNQPYVFEIDGGLTPVYINDHCNRVTSDYLMWYDVTDKIKSRNVKTVVSTDKASGYTGSFDGRIKLITLVVAYDDSDTDEVYYWINQGHDVHSYYVEENGLTYTGKTTFETSDLPSDFEIDSAKLGVVHLASNNGEYTFNSESLDYLSSQGSYSGYQTWDVTDSVYSEVKSVLEYTRNLDITGSSSNYLGAFFKIPVAFLSVKHQGEEVGSIYVESNPKGAEIFIDDESTGISTDSLISALPVGSYSVSVHKDSYSDPDPVDVDVVKGEKETVTFDLVPITGDIEISSEPEGANIILDSEDTAKITDAVLEDVLAGEHTITLTLEGYYSSSQTFTVEEDDYIELNFVLEADPDTNMEDESLYGYNGKEIEVYKRDSIKGGVLLVNSSKYTGLLKKGDSAGYDLDVLLPKDSVVDFARLYLYSTWGHDTVKKSGTKPVLETSLNGKKIYKEKSYRDRKGEGIYNYVAETTCYDVSQDIKSSGDYHIDVTNTGNTNDAFALYGASLVIAYKNPDSPLISYWIAEGCDILLASDEFDTDTESSTTSVYFSGDFDSATNGLLYVISTASSGIEGDDNRIAFNDYEAFNLLNGGSSDISTAEIDAKPFLKHSKQSLYIQSYIAEEKGDYMENRMAVLVLEHSGETGVVDSVTQSSGNGTSASGSLSEKLSLGTFSLNVSDGRTPAQQINYGNGTFELLINEGTSITDSSGMPVETINVQMADYPKNSSWSYAIGPKGAKSDMPMLLKASLQNFSENCEYTFVYYDKDTEEMKAIESLCDSTGVISCRINDLGTYGIILKSDLLSAGSSDSGILSPVDFISDFTMSILKMIGFEEDNKDIQKTASSVSLTQNTSSAALAYNTSDVSEIIQIDPSKSNFNIQICSNPQSAKIYIDGNYTGRTTPFTINLRGGEHSLRLELEDFKDYSETFILSDDTIFYADHEPLFGTNAAKLKFDGCLKESDIEGIGGVYVTSSPKGATIFVNGANTGMETPCVIYGLKNGMNTIRIKKEKITFAETTKKVWVDSGSVTPVDFTQALVSSNHADIDSIEYDGYYFTIDGHFPEYKIPKVIVTGSIDSFITFYTDGKYISHNIRAVSDNYLNDIRPRDYRFGKVLVESVPDGAKIYVDGYDTGYSTPYAIDSLSDGAHLIEVSRPGYIRSGEKILLTPDEAEYDAKVKIILDSYVYGSLEVTSSQDGAKIYLYGKDTGKTTPYTFRYLDIGTIDVKVVGDESTVTLEDVAINPFEISKCHIEL